MHKLQVYIQIKKNWIGHGHNAINHSILYLMEQWQCSRSTCKMHSADDTRASDFRPRYGMRSAIFGHLVIKWILFNFSGLLLVYNITWTIETTQIYVVSQALHGHLVIMKCELYCLILLQVVTCAELRSIIPLLYIYDKDILVCGFVLLLSTKQMYKYVVSHKY